MPRFAEQFAPLDAVSLDLENISSATRVAIWNFTLRFEGLANDFYRFRRSVAAGFSEILCMPVDELPASPDGLSKWLRDTIQTAPWYYIYDMLEWMVEAFAFEGNLTDDDGWFPTPAFLVETANKSLAHGRSPYRFVDGSLAPIITKQEAAEVSRAIAAGSKVAMLKGASEHISTALEMISGRPEADYRNTIKESVSALESAVTALLGESSHSLANSLRALGTRLGLHKALIAALASFYGYASDEEGVRHAMLAKSNVGLPEARYMLISCSAFVNFLVARAEEQGLIPVVSDDRE